MDSHTASLMLGKKGKSFLRLSSGLKDRSPDDLHRCVIGGGRGQLLDSLDCGIGLAQVELSKSTESL